MRCSPVHLKCHNTAYIKECCNQRAHKMQYFKYISPIYNCRQAPRHIECQDCTDSYEQYAFSIALAHYFFHQHHNANYPCNLLLQVNVNCILTIEIRYRTIAPFFIHIIISVRNCLRNHRYSLPQQRNIHIRPQLVLRQKRCQILERRAEQGSVRQLLRAVLGLPALLGIGKDLAEHISFLL